MIKTLKPKHITVIQTQKKGRDITTKIEFNTDSAGIEIIKRELEASGILDFIDEKIKKHSGFNISDIVSTCVYKNTMNLKTFTETAEEFLHTPEWSIDINRTTLSRNCKNIGAFDNLNIFLEHNVQYALKKFGVKGGEIRIVVDGTTIEVSKNAKYEGADWVWDNAKSCTVWGFEVTIIAISFRGIFFPIYFEFGNMKKEDIVKKCVKIRGITNSNKVIFDGGYACDDFYESLTAKGFIFCGKVPKDWIFNNGLDESAGDMSKKLTFKKGQYHAIKAYRVKGKKITDTEYYLCFREGDPRIIITNNLKRKKNRISKISFKEFKKRWDIETCNKELKENFCFEDVPVKNKEGIIGYIFTTLLALNILTIIKLKHRDKLGKLFNKGFKKFIRFFILIKATWASLSKLNKLKFMQTFKFKWFYEDYGLT